MPLFVRGESLEIGDNWLGHQKERPRKGKVKKRKSTEKKDRGKAKERKDIKRKDIEKKGQVHMERKCQD